MLRQAADSLWMVVQRVGTTGPFDPGVTVVVQRTPGTTVETRKISAVRTAGAVVGGVVIVWVSIFLAVLSQFD